MSLRNYDAQSFSRYLQTMVEQSGSTMRKVSLAAGLNHGAVGNFVRKHRRPHRDSCLLLAEVLKVDPNEMLKMAGYAPMPLVDRSMIDPNDFPADVKSFAAKLTAIAPVRRKEIIEGLTRLLGTELG